MPTNTIFFFLIYIVYPWAIIFHSNSKGSWYSNLPNFHRVKFTNKNYANHSFCHYLHFCPTLLHLPSTVPFLHQLLSILTYLLVVKYHYCLILIHISSPHVYESRSCCGRLNLYFRLILLHWICIFIFLQLHHYHILLSCYEHSKLIYFPFELQYCLFRSVDCRTSNHQSSVSQSTKQATITRKRNILISITLPQPSSHASSRLSPSPLMSRPQPTNSYHQSLPFKNTTTN